MSKHIIIIGSGLAGYNTAREVRKLNPDVKITMITHDAGAFYSKPQLSAALTNNKTPEMLMAMSAEKMSASQNLEILTHTEVVKISPKENTVQLAEKSMQYDALVLALGANTKPPYLEGNAANQVMQVNNVYQYAEFRKAIENKKHVTVIGAGLVGCEFANDLILNGFEVDVIDPEPGPITQLLPPEVGNALTETLSEAGVNWHFSHVAKQLNHAEDRLQTCLSNNEMITTDVVLSAIGLQAKTELAIDAGITTKRGIVVDQYCRTSIENIYALGDCAEVCGFTLPYIAPIAQCAKALALTLNGAETKVQYPAMPVVIKTSAYPICVCPPPVNTEGNWQVQNDNGVIRALYKGSNDAIQGFVLTKEAIRERMTLAGQVPAWL